ncbi:DUF551 domain-containing protein [Pasteurella multocida]|uniref:DUF551 domain-containing protein n=1 Tax=Pasteurella multocida TaxID=747 RepID=UPI003AFF7377
MNEQVTENKYFTVNIYDENSISFHKTEEEAKKACLNGAEELYDHATYNDVTHWQPLPLTPKTE